jgi:hypothetical protein
MVAGRAVVKHIPGHQKHVDVFVLDEGRQPVKKGFVFFVAFPAIQGTTKVPVGGVKKLHGFPICFVYLFFQPFYGGDEP